MGYAVKLQKGGAPTCLINTYTAPGSITGARVLYTFTGYDYMMCNFYCVSTANVGTTAVYTSTGAVLGSSYSGWITFNRDISMYDYVYLYFYKGNSAYGDPKANTSGSVQCLQVRPKGCKYTKV